MGMYEYNNRELSQEGITRVYLVTFLDQTNEGKDTEMLIPEAWISETKAEERVAEVNDNGKPEIYADTCKIGIGSEESNKTADIHLALFRRHFGKKKNIASLHTPEVFMSPKAAREREININEEDGRNLEAEVYPLELYSSPENFTGPKSMVTG